MSWRPETSTRKLGSKYNESYPSWTDVHRGLMNTVFLFLVFFHISLFYLALKFQTLWGCFNACNLQATFEFGHFWLCCIISQSSDVHQQKQKESPEKVIWPGARSLWSEKNLGSNWRTLYPVSNKTIWNVSSWRMPCVESACFFNLGYAEGLPKSLFSDKIWSFVKAASSLGPEFERSWR